MPPKSAWATQVDDEEESGKQSLAPLPAAFASEPEAAFPSLGDAARVVETKADRKKKQQKMTLADFNSLGSKAAAASSGKYTVGGARARATQKEQDDILARLPRGPRGDRPPDEGPGLGGGFQGYGGDRGGSRFGDREGEREGRSERRGGWGDRDRSEAGSAASDDGPSRADMADDWGASRKFTPTSDADRRSGGGFGDRDRDRDRGGFGDRDRRGGFGDRGADRDQDVDAGPSRADTSDDWGKNRAPLPAEPPRGSAFGERRSGGGFADRDGFSSRRESDLFSGSTRADEAGTWGRSSGGGSSSGGGGDSWGAPRRTDSDAPPSGDRPRLKLAPRTKPAPVIKVESPPPEQQPKATEPAADEPPKPRAPRPSPFGAARPREQVLAEKATSATTSSAASVAGSATDEKPQAAAAGSGDGAAAPEAAEQPLEPRPTPVAEVPPADKPVEQTLQEAEEQLAKLSTAEAN